MKRKSSSLARMGQRGEYSSILRVSEGTVAGRPARALTHIGLSPAVNTRNRNLQLLSSFPLFRTKTGAKQPRNSEQDAKLARNARCTCQNEEEG